MSSNLKVKKNNSTRTYIGGELLYLDKAKTKQVRELYVRKNNTTKMVWQYDITGPTLYCNQATGAVYYRNNASFAITGTVSDTESGVKSVTVDGTAVNFSTGSWTRTVTLTTGAQTHTVEATDNAGNVSRVYVKTYLDTTAPSLALNQSSVYYMMNTNTLTASGTASDSQSGLASVTVNGNGATISGSSWSKSVSISYNQRTTITAIAKDKCGNSTSRSFIAYATTRSSAPTTLYDAGQVSGEHTYTVSQSYTVPKGANTITLTASTNNYWDSTGWGPRYGTINHYIKDNTTGEVLASYNGTDRDNNNFSNTISTTLSNERSYEHSIIVYSSATVYSAGDKNGITWNSISAYIKATVSYK